MTAGLCVRLGNYWGHSWAAQDAADRFLGLLRPTQWEGYFNKLLPGDRHILEKLAYEEKPVARWQELISGLDGIEAMEIDTRVAKLICADKAKKPQLMKAAQHLRERIMKDT